MTHKVRKNTYDSRTGLRRDGSVDTSPQPSVHDTLYDAVAKKSADAYHRYIYEIGSHYVVATTYRQVMEAWFKRFKLKPRQLSRLEIRDMLQAEDMDVASKIKRELDSRLVRPAEEGQ